MCLFATTYSGWQFDGVQRVDTTESNNRMDSRLAWPSPMEQGEEARSSRERAGDGALAQTGGGERFR